MNKKYDYLVIGSGIAGLSFALKVANHGSVCIITKGELEESATKYAQGGIASVTYEPDTFEKHIKDTIIAGDKINNKETVRKVVETAPDRIKDLIEWGIEFDKKHQDKKEFDLHKEGGHSEFRILHVKDYTGKEIERKLIQRVKEHKNITVLEKHFAIEIITQHHLGEVVTHRRKDIECYGAYVLNLKTNKVITIAAKTTTMSTGGIGSTYQTTTNPTVATGDGIAMVYRAKGFVEGMEFVQFHPTALYNPQESPSFLITEAIRGYGAKLRTKDGNRFMYKYDERAELAPRDIVARAIDHEMKMHGNNCVYLDVTHKDAESTRQHFPNINKHCWALGIDITKDYIPVAPAAHYACGGIKVDKNACASINRLYAVGECASTGLHGANRLASNSLLEALVFADSASKHAINHINEYEIKSNIPRWNDEGTSLPEEMVLITQSRREVGELMSNYVGIVRSNLRLKRAFDRLELLYHETENLFDRSVVSKEICELRNVINIGYLVIIAAQERKESRGLHYTLDYPHKIED